MKRIPYILLLPGMLCLFLIMTTACKDNCKGVLCQNGGACIDGGCSCARGWEGEDCTFRTSDRFNGSWFSSELCGVSADTTYSVTVGPAANQDYGFTMAGLYNADDSLVAIVDSTSFSIAHQPYGPGWITGSGELRSGDDSLYVVFSITIGGSVYSCVSRMKRM